jgi:hypothetical protein
MEITLNYYSHEPTCAVTTYLGSVEHIEKDRYSTRETVDTLKSIRDTTGEWLSRRKSFCGVIPSRRGCYY